MIIVDRNSRIGAIRYNKYGESATCIDYQDYKHITIQLDNNEIINTRWDSFDKGNFSLNWEKSYSNRIGATNNNYWGEKGEVIQIEKGGKVVIKTERGKVVKARWGDFLDGKFDCHKREDRIGEKRINTSGIEGECIEYVSARDITVRLSTGEILKTTWAAFEHGSFGPNNKSKYRLGERKKNNKGSFMTIINYANSDDIDVKFDSGFIVKHTKYGQFKQGCIRDLLYPTYYGRGYLGIGKYGIKDEINGIKVYPVWRGIFVRCYASNENENPTYVDCEVHEDWYDYQNFCRWVEENSYCVPNEKMVIDKDLLVKDNKIYGPETCCILPNEINLYLKKDVKAIRGQYPIGVIKNKTIIGKQYTMNIHRKRLGTIHKDYETIEEAFANYKKLKEDYVKYLADIYKTYLPQYIYEALYKYEILITD